MTKIKVSRIDRSTIRYIDQRLDAALKDLGDELGVTIRVAGGSFSAYTYNPKLEIKLVDQTTGAVHDPVFDSMCELHKLDRHMTSRDGYQLTGWSGARPKKPWDVLDPRNGVSYRATDGWVKSRFMKLSPAAVQAVPQPSSVTTPTSPSGRTYEPAF